MSDTFDDFFEKYDDNFFESVDLDACYGSIAEALLHGIKPNPKIGIKDYCEQNLYLTQDTPKPGLVDFSHTPYLIPIMKDLEDDSGVEEVRVKKGRQLGFTLLLVSWMLWGAAVSPAPSMVVFPTDFSKKRFSKQKLGPAFKRCKDLQGKIGGW